MAEKKAKKVAAPVPTKGYYALQKGRTETNKKRKLAKRIRQHPNDTQAVKIFRERYGN